MIFCSRRNTSCFGRVYFVICLMRCSPGESQSDSARRPECLNICPYRDKDMAIFLKNQSLSLLNQNKVFQKLTHVIMLYVCIVTILYFYNKKENKEEEEEDKDEG